MPRSRNSADESASFLKRKPKVRILPGVPYKPDWSRISTSCGYKVVYCGDHPKAWGTGYVLLHRVIMEMKLSRLLEENEIVHHIDGNKMNNSVDNLELTDQNSHARNHASRAVPVIIECVKCGKKVERVARRERHVSKTRKRGPFCSKSCAAKKDKSEVPHGTSSGYGYHKCRCDLCKEANKLRARAYRKSRKKPKIEVRFLVGA